MLRRKSWLIILIALLMAFALRVHGLGRMNSAILYDEAAYGADALSLIQSPRLTPYFEANNGREGLWMYMLAPALATIGVQPFTLRIVAVFASLLTLAAVYRLGREIIGKEHALWVIAAMAVFYWPTHLGHIGFRAALYPLIGAISFAALLHAYRLNQLRRWAMAGLLLGLLSYTYIAARVWVGLGVILLLAWLIWQPARRRGALLALAVAGIAMLPLALYLLIHDDGGTRTTQVAIESVGDLLENMRLWLNAWFYQGDGYMTHNAPGRPIFDVPTGLLALFGIIGLWKWARRWHIGLLVLLFLGSLAPALLSIDNPHMLRSYGAVVPLAILLGSGAAWLVYALPRWGYGLVTLLLAWAALNTYTAFTTVAESWDTFLPGEYYTMAAIDYLSQSDIAQAGQPIAFTPFDEDYPIPTFRAGDMSGHRLIAYRPEYCIVYDADQPVLTALLPPYIQAHQQILAQDGLSELAYTDPDGRFALMQTQADPALMQQPATTFGDAITLRGQLSNQQASPGDTLTVTIAFQAEHTLNADYNSFVQVWGTPSPLEGGRLWAQSDLRLCEPYPSHVWQTNDVIVQAWSLVLPEDMPQGDYDLIVGVYNSQSNRRLLMTDGSDVVVLGVVTVQP